MSTHPALIPSRPDPHQPKYPGDQAFVAQSRLVPPNAQTHGQSLPPEPGNLSLHELAQWWDRTLYNTQVGFPTSPDVSPEDLRGASQ